MRDPQTANDLGIIIIIAVALIVGILTMATSGCAMTKGALNDISRAANYIDRSIVQPE